MKRVKKYICDKKRIWKNKQIIKCSRKLLKNENFSIISQNCIGGVFYHDMGMKFLSPTINLFMSASDFMKFVSNLKYYFQQDLQMYYGEKYPIGKLDDISINFMHYHTCEEAKSSWETRKQRINYEKIIVLCTDRDGFGEKEYQLWKEIQYPKLLFTVNENYSNDKDVVYYPEYSNEKNIPDIIDTREFYKNDVLVHQINMI